LKVLGVSYEAIATFLKGEKSNFILGLNSRKASYKMSPKYTLNLMEYETSKVTFENSFYKISRVSFNDQSNEALVAIELVCYDCGGLVLYKFSQLSSGGWKLDNLINLWIN